MGRALQIDGRARVVGGRAQNTESCCCGDQSFIIIESLDCGERRYMRCYDIDAQGAWFGCETPDGCLPVGTIIRTAGPEFANQCWRVVEVVAEEPTTIIETIRSAFQQQCFGEGEPGCVDYSDVFCPKECESYWRVSEYWTDTGCLPCGNTLYVVRADIQIDYEVRGEQETIQTTGVRQSSYEEIGTMRWTVLADPNAVGDVIFVPGTWTATRAWSGFIRINQFILYDCTVSDIVSLSDVQFLSFPSLCGDSGSPFLAAVGLDGGPAFGGANSLLNQCDQSQSGPPEFVFGYNLRTLEQMGCQSPQVVDSSSSDSCNTIFSEETYTHDDLGYFNLDASGRYVYQRDRNPSCGGNLLYERLDRSTIYSQRVTYQTCVLPAGSRMVEGNAYAKSILAGARGDANLRAIEQFMGRASNCTGCGG